MLRSFSRKDVLVMAMLDITVFIMQSFGSLVFFALIIVCLALIQEIVVNCPGWK